MMVAKRIKKKMEKVDSDRIFGRFFRVFTIDGGTGVRAFLKYLNTCFIGRKITSNLR